MDLVLPIIFFGVLQGFTEVFPVSSSGHLVLASYLLNYPDLDLKLAVALHSGVLLAIVIFFRLDLLSLGSDLWKSLPDIKRWIQGDANPFSLVGEQTVIFYLLLSLLPVMIEGLCLREIVAQVFKQPYWVSFFLVINAVLLIITANRAHGERTLKELNARDFLLIGLFQGIAVLPGISRLGIVICAGLWLHLYWQEAVKLAFIISVPVIAGSILLEGNELLALIQNGSTLLNSIYIAVFFAAIFSLLGLKFLTSRYLERRRLAFFGSYCLIAGISSFIYLYFWS